MDRKFVLLLVTLVMMIAPALTAQVSSTDAAFKEQFEKGKRALTDGKYGDAIGAFKKAVRIQGDCYACYQGMASAYAQLRQERNALEACDKAADVAANDGTRAAAHSLKGNILVGYADDPKDLAGAESEFRKAVELDSKVALYHLNLAIVLLRQSKDEAAKPELEACLAAQPDPGLAKQARSMLADPRRGRETFAPEFHVKTLTGDEISLEQFAGKVLVMDFWATWCSPCRDSVPELKALTRKYPADKLVLISVSVDEDDQAWREFIQKKHMDWMQYRDADGQLRRAFAVRGFPTYLVIDGDGIIRQRMTGLNPQETVVHRLRKDLEAMFQAKK